MKNQNLFNETIDILVKAYLNDTLIHNRCSACAVGNIVAQKKYNSSLIPEYQLWSAESNFRDSIGWQSVFCSTMDENGEYDQDFFPMNYKGLAKEQIDATGYTWQELAQIEAAFEGLEFDDEYYTNTDAYVFNGLMAVVDTLCKIHECEEIKEETKSLFVKS